MTAVGHGGNSPREHPRGEGASAPEEAVQELRVLLQGLSWEWDGECELEVGVGDAMYHATDSIIKLWASYHGIRLDEDAEYCEPDANTYASGIGFRHTAFGYCAAILADGRHIHIDGREGYVGSRSYYKLTEVRVERVERDD